MLESFRALVNGGADWAAQSAPSPGLLAALALAIAVATGPFSCPSISSTTTSAPTAAATPA